MTGSPDDQLGLLWARLAALEQALDEARPWRQHCAGMLVSEQMNVAELQVEAGAEPASQGDSRDALGSQLKWAWAEIHALRSALEGRRGSWWRRQR